MPCVVAVFKARPSLASLSPEGPPASRSRPVWGRSDLLWGTGGRWVEPGRKRRHVQGGDGRLEAGSLAGWCGHAALVGACREGWGDVGP